MKIILKILFVIFILWLGVGIYLLNIGHPKGQLAMGLCVFYLFFVLMPLFIYHRYKDGKYKKYIINDEKLKNAFKNQD